MSEYERGRADAADEIRRDCWSRELAVLWLRTIGALDANVPGACDHERGFCDVTRDFANGKELPK